MILHEIKQHGLLPPCCFIKVEQENSDTTYLLLYSSAFAGIHLQRIAVKKAVCEGPQYRGKNIHLSFKKYNCIKKIIATIAFALASYYVISQPVAKSKSFVVTLPAGITKLTEPNFKEFSQQKFKKKTVDVEGRELFRKGNVLFSYWVLNYKPRFKESLEEKQKVLSSLYGPMFHNVYELRDTKIVTVNGKRFLIINGKSSDNYFTYFYSDYNQNSENECLGGNLEYKPTDEADAKKLLQEFLEGVQNQSVFL